MNMGAADGTICHLCFQHRVILSAAKNLCICCGSKCIDPSLAGAAQGSVSLPQDDKVDGAVSATDEHESLLWSAEGSRMGRSDMTVLGCVVKKKKNFWSPQGTVPMPDRAKSCQFSRLNDFAGGSKARPVLPDCGRTMTGSGSL